MDNKKIINKKESDKRVTTRKIGNSTYIVSSSFKEGKERDIVSTVSRLIQHEKPAKPGA
jgi:hypothetical protein